MDCEARIKFDRPFKERPTTPGWMALNAALSTNVATA